MSTCVPDFAPVRFSTSDLAERDRLPAWRERFGGAVVRVDIEPLTELPFHAKATLRALPGLRTIAWRGSAVRNRRSAALAADGDEAIGLFINLGEKAAVSQRDRDVVLGRGDAVLISHDPSVVIPSPEGFVGVIVPRAALASRIKEIDDAVLRPIPRATEPLRLLMSYVQYVRDKLALSTPELRQTAVDHVQDLVALSLHPPDEETDNLSAVATARLGAALDRIVDRFDDPDLSLAKVAGVQHISPRYLQRLMETTGIPFTARVNELRLQRAFALLAEGDSRRIIDIALQAGFSDISHFNRLFRSRFGDTPSGVRRIQMKKK
ncbi:MAG TPA: AraC family transcriptional regulator [Pseudolabrys sp.]|nr:AraC family transcriptional regulator [Pseudolabrys sp.]